MTTKFIDVTGKTEDEAIANALAQLGLDRDEVSVEILERAKKGFLGIGASPAKVRVTYEVPEEVSVRPVEKRPERLEKAIPAAAPQERAPRPEPKAPRAPEAPGPAKTPKASAPTREAPKAAPELPELPKAPALPGTPCDDEKSRQITTFLTGLLEHMGNSAQVKVYLDDEGRYKVILEGEKLGALIGRRGETLDAIQQLTNYSVNRGGEKRVRIHVDAENYRLKREQSLQQLARKVAGKVLKYRRNVTLEPMNAYERHVIHTALQDVEGVTTYSMGTDPNRRVIVAYDRTGAR